VLSWPLPGLQAGQTPQRRPTLYPLVPECRGLSREQPREHQRYSGPVRSRTPPALRSSATRDRSAGRARQGRCRLQAGTAGYLSAWSSICHERPHAAVGKAVIPACYRSTCRSPTTKEVVSLPLTLRQPRKNCYTHAGHPPPPGEPGRRLEVGMARHSGPVEIRSTPLRGRDRSPAGPSRNSLEPVTSSL
jgi:hypothetical protein